MRNINTLNFILLLVLFSFLFACSEKKSGDEIIKTDIETYKVFHHKDKNYSINIPVDWYFQKKKSATIIAYSSKEGNDDAFRESIDVVVINSGFNQRNNGTVEYSSFDLDQFYDQHIKMLAETDFNIVVEDSGEKAINGKKAKWAILKDKANKKDLRLHRYFIVDEEKAFIITCSMQNDKFHKFGPIFNEIVNSFRINV